jgi:alkyldihydroxyacetonephosphate synthase
VTRRAPANPVPLVEQPQVRFPSDDLPEAFLQRLRDACAAVDTGERSRLEAGRDWWPLAMTWVAKGQAPARAGAVASPTSVAEVGAVLRLCSDARVPVTTAAGRSGVCGNSMPVFGGVVLDTTGLAGIADVDDASLLLDVHAGTFGDDLEDGLRKRHGLTLGHWPQSIALSTVGGWLACRSAGQYSTRYGKIEDMVVGLQAVLADGTVVTTGGAGPRAAMGPDLTQVFVGSEGTLGVITRTQLRLHPVPVAERRGAWGFPSFEDGLQACRRTLRRGATPAVLRLYDVAESKRHFGIESHVLVVLDEAEPRLADAVLHVVGEECASAERLDDALLDRWLAHRNDVSGLAALTSRGYVLDTTEIAARWSVLPRLYDEVVAALQAIPGNLSASAHQSHAYPDGACLYFTYAFGPDVVDGDAAYRAAWDAVCTVTLRHGGAISHHHGIGLNRGRFLPEALGTGFDVLRSLKQTLDPAGVLNPGKLGLPSPFGSPVWD